MNREGHNTTVKIRWWASILSGKLMYESKCDQCGWLGYVKGDKREAGFAAAVHKNPFGKHTP